MTNAAELVSALEALPAGAPFADAAEDAAAAVTEARSRARLALFPTMEAPQPASAYAAYQHHVGAIHGQLWIGMVELHREALTVQPALAELLRGKRARADVLGLAAEEKKGRLWTPQPHAGSRLDRYEKEIALQLVAVEGHDLAQAAGEFLAILELETRLSDEIADREGAAEDELAEIERIRREEDAAMVKETSRRASFLKAAEEAHREAVAQAQLAHQRLINARVAGPAEEDPAPKPKRSRSEVYTGWEPM